MKKFFVLAAAAFALVACVQPEELPVVDPEVNGDGAVAFSVYAPKTTATRAGTPMDITNANIGTIGFGVFAYYTAGEKYDANAKPNFMYNQKVEKKNDAWTYEPVKYWPNEYGNAAISDEIDYVTFFAYAPWTDIEPTTGEVTVPNANPSTDAERAENELAQKKNIISVNKNNATGDPIIKYVVDTDPKTSVDLLWGVAAPDAAGKYSAINAVDPNATTTPTQAQIHPVTPGFPFIDLVKPGNPQEDKISFNLKHSLAKVKFTIDYIADDFTPDGTEGKEINAAETRIFVRSFKISGWATKGALNLNNKEGKAGEPLWKDFDGVKDLAFNEVTFHDGRKDGKEGDVNGAQTNEENQGLNPTIIENFAATVAPTADEKNVKFGATKTAGVTKTPKLLFASSTNDAVPSENGGYFYVIPRNEGSAVDATIVYDVETIDGNLAGLLSDGATHGSSIENVITKQHILGEGKDFEPGKQYLIKIHIGMTSVKIDAFVTEWQPTTDEDVDLPDNQPMTSWTVDGIPGYFLSDPSTTWIDLSTWEAIQDEASWNASATLAAYHADNPDEDRYNYDANRWAWESDKVGGNWPDYCRQSWLGAINSAAAKYPWCVVTLPTTPFKGKLRFVYKYNADTEVIVYPWGEAIRNFTKGRGIASMAEEFYTAFAEKGLPDLGCEIRVINSQNVVYPKAYYAASPADDNHTTTSWCMDPVTQEIPASLDFTKLTVQMMVDSEAVHKHETKY